MVLCLISHITASFDELDYRFKDHRGREEDVTTRHNLKLFRIFKQDLER